MDLSNNLYCNLIKLKKKIPKPIKHILKTIFSKLGFIKLFSKIFKYNAELDFQKSYVDSFRNNKPVFVEHWIKYRYLNEIQNICKINETSFILDVGCGISTVLLFIKGKRFGIDPLADEYKKIYCYEKNINIKKGYGEKIPFEKEYFDIVFCTNVLDHVSNPTKTINEVFRVLKPNGYFILTVEIFEHKIIRDFGHPHLFFKKDILEITKKKFDLILNKESQMMDIALKNINGKNELILVESEKQTRELVLLLKKKYI